MSNAEQVSWDIDGLTERFCKIAMEDIVGYKPSEGLRAKPFSKVENNLTLDFASYGSKYFDCERRLLVIGRAMGKCNNHENKRMVIRYNPDESMNPVINKDAIRYSIVKELLVDTRWMLNCKKTPYLKLIRDCTVYLNPDYSDYWPDCIAYTNLFKFVPFGGGNPCTGLVRAQKTINMADILSYEINILQPTHILLIVGVDNYFWYPAIFRDVINSYRVPNSSRVPSIKVVNRPEVRKKDVRNGIKNSIAAWKTI